MGGTLTELNKLGRNRGQFAAELAMEGLLRKRQRAVEHQARQESRAIPTSGSGRRRAKAIRNRDAWREVAATEPYAQQRGRMYEGDLIPAAD